MDAIRSYLETMFANLPQSPDVMRAKGELLQMMEDKYHELIATGRSENEAVGAVISEFGNLNELAAELGISQQMEGKAAENRPLSLTGAQVRKFLSERIEASHGISIGVILCILAVTPLLTLTGLAEMGYINEKVGIAIGVAILLIVVAIAVYFFITQGIRTEKYEKLEKANVSLDPQTYNEVKRMKEEYQPAFARTIATGVVIILIGVIILVTTAILEIGHQALAIFATVLLLALVALAVRGFIIAGMRSESYDMLLNEGDYTPSHKKSNRIMDVVAGPYWMLVVVIYLAWSFISGSWESTWIIWPIAGVLFGLIAAVLSGIDTHRN
ncbi:MAG TPA: permease prefix domain 1-containing protein [Bellilinea sp.]|nr:permease prefix domain 1-containing protein [Bellilinea sp.]